MTKYHINPATGRPNICNPVKTGVCKYATDGENPPHYDSKEEAKAAYEVTGAKEFGATSSLSKPSQNTVSINKEELASFQGIGELFFSSNSDEQIRRVTTDIAYRLKNKKEAYESIQGNDASSQHRKNLLAREYRGELADTSAIIERLSDSNPSVIDPELLKTDLTKTLKIQDLQKLKGDTAFASVHEEKDRYNNMKDYQLRNQYVNFSVAADTFENYKRDFADTSENSDYQDLKMHEDMQDLSVITHNNALVVKEIMESRGINVSKIHPIDETEDITDVDYGVSYSKQAYNNRYYLEQDLLYRKDSEVDNDNIEYLSEYATFARKYKFLDENERSHDDSWI